MGGGAAMKRAFASQADFDAWHESAKAATGLPIAGVNASTGEAAPDKQQTVDLTALPELEGGGVVLEAVVTNESLAARGLQDALIRADLLTADEIAALASAYEAWATGSTYEAGDLREHAGTLWKCVQGHTSQSDWQPPDVPALWTHAAPANVIPEWTAPSGAHDAYNTGDMVTFEGSVYRSLIDANVWSPAAYPAGWELVP